ncbi:SpoIIE family protein phosphatase [Aquipuribacter hungaricus]|uniref:SpoIIE family protein phosphatase n=1 Tax=Aquipuribacter hungaricus TaxID=545624 RepID=A0ABV7WKE3_9MICO
MTEAAALTLPAVAHDFPAAVLLVDTDAGAVVFVNDLARQLAPGLELPADLEAWSREAQLQVVSGGPLGDSSTPLASIVAGDPSTGRQVSAALQSGASTAREALWAIGMPLHEAPEPLRARSLLVLLPLRFPEAIADAQAAAAASRAHRSVLSSGLAIAISDPTADDDPLVWVSRSFEQLTGHTSAEVLGRNCRFLQGPDTDPDAVARVREGLAADRTVSVTLLNYRHDGSAFYNHLVVSAVFDAAGRLSHRVAVLSDVTGQVLAAHERDAARAEADRARRAEVAAEDARRFGRLLLSLSEALTATTTVEQVAAAITDVVATELGAAGGGLLLADTHRQHLDFVTLEEMPPGTDAAWSRIGWDADAPVAVAVRSRQPVYYPDRDALLAAHPTITDQADVPVMGASANLPLVAGGEVAGAVFLYWDRSYVVLEHQQDVLAAVARYTAQAVQRAQLLTERRTAAEVLQRSLLTRLPEPDHLELRARYVPAAVDEHVGGDWYDAVVLPDGSTTVVIGDVAGHDIAAAARMGQLRGLLRAYAFDRAEPPSEVVARLDRAVTVLHPDTLATLVMARVEQTEADRQAGLRRVRWTNAGHLPPIILHADGSTEVLTTVPELLVGLQPGAARSDHDHVLLPGSTFLLFTDGVVEHRGRSIDDGLTDLRGVLSRHATASLQDLLDQVVAELVGSSPDDDCAVLAVRAHPEDRPRPTEAGPNRLA